jgi:hypothetical protein
MTIKTKFEAKIRLYDGTGTPLYLEVDLDVGDFSSPLGTPRPEEILVLDRGRMSADAHYRRGPDDKLMEPVPVSFTVRVTDAAQYINIRNWIRAMNDALVTQVNSNTLVSTQGDTKRDGTNFNPVFADANKSTCNIEYLIEMGATDLGILVAEVYFPPDQLPLAEAEDAITLALAGMCYGTITDLTIFTTGTDVEA